jgi:heme/copper-type cytochrome/quinol oxidase subunit 2
VSLYALWAKLGVAPIQFWEADAPVDPAKVAAGHGEHGGAVSGPSTEEFKLMAEDFISRHRQPDGSILVEPLIAMAMEGHAGHDMPPSEIYLLAQQFSFDPSVLKLRAGAPYRFRMMASDVAHGTSIQLGRGSHIIRLPLGVLVERTLTFARPGRNFLYCTSYCGEGHHQMSGVIEIL